MKKTDNAKRTAVEKCREFVSFMLCRQAEEIASYAHDMLVAGIITAADMDELNKSIVMAFGLTADEVRKQRDAIDEAIKARIAAYKAMREGVVGEMRGRFN